MRNWYNANFGLKVFLFIGLIGFSSFTFGNTLPFPGLGNSMRTPELYPRSISRHKNQLYLFYRNRDVFVMRNFLGLKKSQEASFGKLVDAKRIRLPPNFAAGDFVGSVVIDTRILALDGEHLNAHVFDAKTGVHISSRSIPWDTIRPASDQRGEPTTPEVNSFRKRFVRAFKQVDGLKFAGFAPTKSTWSTKGKVVFFGATRMAGFPLVLIQCTRVDLSNCMVTRGCFVDQLGVKAENITGLGYSEMRDRLVLGDRSNNTLTLFRPDKCFHIARKGKLSLPKKLKTLASIHVDHEDMLWLTTEKQDDYNNATFYAWPGEAW